ncbi:MAG: AEC family transporter [Rhodospirillaceae bacterium]
MFVELLNIIAPVAIIAALGFIWDRMGLPFDANMVARLITSIGVPCLIFSILLENRPDLHTISSMATAALFVVGCIALLAGIVLRLAGYPLKVFLPALVFPNAGNMGIPLCMFAFGDEGLALSVSFFAVTALTQFTLGIGIAAGRIGVRDVIANPVLWATAVALILLINDAELPRLIKGTVDSFAGIVIPLMLMSLGISLSRLRPGSLVRSTAFSIARLLIGFVAGYGAATMLGLDGVARAAVIIQSSMPTAVFNYLIAARFNNRPDEVAGIVVVSTAISFLTLPFLLGFAVSLDG